MSEAMHISATERGQIRVFAIDLPDAEARAFAQAPGDAGGWPLREALGAAALDPEWVDLVVPGDLGEMTLSTFLTEGPGASAAGLAGDRARLDALETPVAVMPSQAFRQQEQELAPHAPLRWIGTYPEARATATETPLRSAGAAGHLSPQGAARAVKPSMRAAGYVVAALIVLGAIALMLAFRGGR